MPAAALTAPLFAALGDPVRFAIIMRLVREGPLPTVELTRGSGVSRQAVTKHLKVLEDVGLLDSARVARDREWRLEARRVADMSKMLARLSAQWDARLERLRAFVEDRA